MSRSASVQRLLAALCSIAWCSCGGTTRTPDAPQPSAARADLVIRGGPILTLDEARPEVEALAVRGGEIVAAGSARDVQGLVAAGTEVVELHGRSVVPGFTDCHTHIGITAYPATQVFLPDPSKEDLVARLRREVTTDPRLPLVLTGWIPAHYTGTRAELDSVSAEKPILVFAPDNHAAWLNTAALRWLGFDRADSGKPDDAIELAPDGLPAGPLWGIGWTRWINRRANDLAEDQDIEREVLSELNRAAAFGITAVHNMSFSSRVMRILAGLADRDALPIRVREMADGLDAPSVQWARAAHPRSPARFRIIAYKYFLDGAPFSGNAAYRSHARRGNLRLEPARLRAIIADHTGRGERVALHAVGELATAEAVSTIASIGAAAVRLRPRIEHADIMDPADEARLAELGIILSMQPTHFPLAWPAVTRDTSLAPAAEHWGFASRARRGVVICLGSDGVVPPLVNISLAVRGPTPAEAMTLPEALAAHTRNGAVAAGDQDRLGVLSVGRAADLVILSRDPRSVPPEALPGIQVDRTIVDGRTAFERPPDPQDARRNSSSASDSTSR
jgi:predicted amidohydrolase YtcJ